MCKILLILLSVGLSTLASASEPVNDLMVFECGGLSYVPLHSATDVEKKFRTSNDIPDSRALTIMIYVDCKGAVTDVQYTVYD